MNSKHLAIMKEYLRLLKNNLILIFSSIILVFIINTFLNLNSVIQAILWVLIYFQAFAFFRFSIFPTSTSANTFSWKFIQGLPLSKKELFWVMGVANFILTIPLMVTFLVSHSFLVETEMFSFLKDMNLAKASLNLLTIGLFISLGSIRTLILLPRREYSSRTNSNLLTFLEYMVYGTCIAVYSVAVLAYLNLEYKFPIPIYAKITMDLLKTFAFSWFVSPVVIIASYLQYKSTLKLWKNEKKGYSKYKSTTGRIVKLSLGIISLLGPVIYVYSKESDLYQNSALNEAINKKDYAEFEKLLKEKKNIDEANEFGFKPMFVAIHEGSLESIKYLESKGASFSGNLTKLSPNHAYYDALMLAIDSKKLNVLEYIISKGFDPNKYDSRVGFYPIHLMAYSCKPKMIDYLLTKGVDINVLNNRGETPILVAVRANCLTSFITLRDAGARLDIADKEGKKALDYFTENPNSDFAYLVEKYSRKPAAQQ